VQDVTTATDPILSFGGGGCFFFWMLGCLRYLHRNFDLSRVQLRGASAGGLIATLAACGVDEDKAVRADTGCGLQLGKRARAWWGLLWGAGGFGSSAE